MTIFRVKWIHKPIKFARRISYANTMHHITNIHTAKWTTRFRINEICVFDRWRCVKYFAARHWNLISANILNTNDANESHSSTARREIKLTRWIVARWDHCHNLMSQKNSKMNRKKTVFLVYLKTEKKTLIFHQMYVRVHHNAFHAFRFNVVGMTTWSTNGSTICPFFPLPSTLRRPQKLINFHSCESNANANI